MDKVDTTQRGPATPIFDMLIAEVGLSWVDTMLATNDAESRAATASPADRNAPEG